MSLRSSVDRLPTDAREWLESQLLARNFSGYVDLTEELNKKLADWGVEIQITKSSLHRWGQSFAERVESIKAAREMAKAIARELDDDAGLMNDAVLAVVQEKLLRTTLEEELNPKVLSSISHAVADIARASVVSKKHMIAVREKAAATAESVAAQVKKAGLSAEAAEQIRREILGIAND